jgi:hypothetical protein
VNQKRREAKVVACNATHSARNCSLDLRYWACEAEIKGKRQGSKVSFSSNLDLSASMIDAAAFVSSAIG